MAATEPLLHHSPTLAAHPPRFLQAPFSEGQRLRAHPVFPCSGLGPIDGRKLSGDLGVICCGLCTVGQLLGLCGPLSGFPPGEQGIPGIILLLGLSGGFLGPRRLRLLLVVLLHLGVSQASDAVQSLLIHSHAFLAQLPQVPCMRCRKCRWAVEAAMCKEVSSPCPVGRAWTAWGLGIETATRRCAEAFVANRAPLPDDQTRESEGRPSWGNCAATKPLRPSAPLASSGSIRTSCSSSILCLTHAGVGKASMIYGIETKPISESTGAPKPNANPPRHHIFSEPCRRTKAHVRPSSLFFVRSMAAAGT